MDRLVASGTAHGWFAFDAGLLSAREIATHVAERAKSSGLEARTFAAPGAARLTVIYPEGRATIDVFDVPRAPARRRLAICRCGASAAVAQARVLLRDAIARSGEFSEVLGCDEAAWRTLSDLAEHRDEVRRQRAARVVGVIGWLAATPAALLMTLFVLIDLAATNMTCGPGARGTHVASVPAVGLVGCAFFAVVFVPGVRMLRPSRRTLGRSIAGALLGVCAILVALVDWVVLAHGMPC